MSVLSLAATQEPPVKRRRPSCDNMREDRGKDGSKC